MKNIWFLILGMVLFVSNRTEAQISLKQTLNFSSYYDISQFSYIDGTKGYVGINNNTVKIFNSDFSFIKEISLNIPSFYTIESISTETGRKFIATTHLFNDDPYLEFVVTLKDLTSGKLGFAIVNEKKEILFSDYVENYNTDWRMYTFFDGLHTNLLFNWSPRINIYTLPGTERVDNNGQTTSTNSLTPVKIMSDRKAYPNPSNSIINLSYTIPNGKKMGVIEVYDTTGKLVKSLFVDGSFPSVSLDVSNYHEGTYIYNLTVDDSVVSSNKFLVSK